MTPYHRTAGETEIVIIPVFSGQGTSEIDASSMLKNALAVSRSLPLATHILSQCHAAFLEELSPPSLSETFADDQRIMIDIQLADFITPQDLLMASVEAKYSSNPVMVASSLFLLQLLCFLEYVDRTSIGKPWPSPLTHADCVQFIGFSSGILPACLFATTSNNGTQSSTLSVDIAARRQLEKHALAIYRFAVILGIRLQIHKQATLQGNTPDGTASYLPWSAVVTGASRPDVNAAVTQYCEQISTGKRYANPLVVTAHMTAESVTVSGHPTQLQGFLDYVTAGGMGKEVMIKPTSIRALYHSPAHVATRTQILEDVRRRNLPFPTFSDILFPIRDTFTGKTLTTADVHKSTTLLEVVLDMLLTKPIEWKSTLETLVTELAQTGSKARIELVNVGPGPTICRGVERALRAAGFDASSVDPALTSLRVGSTSATDASQTISTPTRIAIVGMAVNMPGAPNIDALWHVLEDGVNTISEIPADRFTASLEKAPGRAMRSHPGNFIANVAEFDYRFFNISPREAKSMDPQQRLLLQTAYTALENSGHIPAELTPGDQFLNGKTKSRGDTFGCYVGAATNDYVQNLRDNIDVYYSTGTLHSFLSGRVSYALGLSGPSIVSDTACSSSTVAVYQACRALANGDCDAALAGGVNVISSPDMYIGLDRAHFLSPTGQSKSFDVAADGYSRSEGCGMFVLKRLEDAERENDCILGVIRGVEVNQSGNACSITHPHEETQQLLFERLIQRSGVARDCVSVVEAHGTGTQAGDPVELSSIRNVFARRSHQRPLFVTSIKANIGHLEAASGTAGLAKILLMFKHRVIPKQISLTNLNPKIKPLGFDDGSDGCVIPRENTVWNPERNAPRMALLNNFGAAGSNAAMLIEEYFVPISTEPLSTSHPQSYVFGISAKSHSALQILLSRYIDWLRSPASADTRLVDIAYTMTARRIIYPHKLAVRAEEKKELIGKLDTELRRLQEDPQLFTKPSSVGGAVFVFSGQGGQYLGMGRSLYETSTLFKQCIDLCDTILIKKGFTGVSAIVQAADRLGGTSLDSSSDELQAFQSSTFAIQYSLARLWISWGVVPVAVIGHSLGEYAALVVANVLTLEDAIILVATRAQLMAHWCIPRSTGMLAVNRSAHDAIDLARSVGYPNITLAVINSHTDCVLAGSLADLRNFKVSLQEKEGTTVKSTMLDVPFGYHSPAMNPILGELSSIGRRCRMKPPSIPVVSNVFGNVVLPRPVGSNTTVLDGGYFANHCRNTVSFAQGVQALLDLQTSPDFPLPPITAWIELGPHPTTLPMLKTLIPSVDSVHTLMLPSLRKQHDSWTTLMDSLIKLFVSGSAVVNWRTVFGGPVQCVGTLPPYPFAGSNFWVPYRPDQSQVASTQDQRACSPRPECVVSAPVHTSLLCSYLQHPSAANDYTSIFETNSAKLAPLIMGHIVGGVALCPASVYLEMVLEGLVAVQQYLGGGGTPTHHILRNVEFTRPLVYNEGVALRVSIIIRLAGDKTSGTFNVRSDVVETRRTQYVDHIHGEYKIRSNAENAKKLSRKLPLVHRRMLAVVAQVNSEMLSRRTMYEIIFPRVVAYASDYQTVEHLTLHPNGLEGRAIIQIPFSLKPATKPIVSPVFMDTLLHTAGFIANMQIDFRANDAFICTHVGSLTFSPELITDSENSRNTGSTEYVIYSVVSWVAAEGIMLADSYALRAVAPTPNTYEQESGVVVVAHLRGIQFRKVTMKGFVNSLAKASGVVHRVSPASSNKTNPNMTASSCDTDSSSTTPHSFQPSQSASSQSSMASGHPNSNGHLDVRNQVSKIVSELCDISTTDITYADMDGVELAALGVDSLMSIELLMALKKAFPGSGCDSHSLHECVTVGDIVRMVDSPTLKISALEVYSTGQDVTSHEPASPVIEHSAAQPTPRTAQRFENLSTTIRRLLASILEVDVREVTDDTELGNLGMDSLMSIEVVHALNLHLRSFGGMQVPPDFFQTSTTMRDLFEFLRESRVGAPVMPGALHDEAQTALIEIQQGPGASSEMSLLSSPLPLFLIHDGSGLVSHYQKITNLDRRVWGIQNPYMFHPNVKVSSSDGGKSVPEWSSIIEMATSYANAICSVMGDASSVLVGGWSFGGVVAYESARQLAHRGVVVKGLILIDTPSPVQHVPLPADIIDAILAGDCAPGDDEAKDNKSYIRRERVREQFTMHSRLLEEYCYHFAHPTDGVMTPYQGPVVYLRSKEAYTHENLGMIPQWLTDRSSGTQHTGWEQVVRMLQIIDIPGNHFQPFMADNIIDVSHAIKDGCLYLEQL